MAQTLPNPRCFLDFKKGDEELGRVIIELFIDIVPKTCTNFISLCTGKHKGKIKGKRLYYKKSVVHRVIEGFMIQMGDFTNGDGTGGYSIYGKTFDDENFKIPHSKYCLSMANAGKNTNGSQFFICTGNCNHLNGKHVVFGKVIHGKDVIDTIEKTETKSNDRPIIPIIISKCGQLMLVKRAQQSMDKDDINNSNKNNNESASESESETESQSESQSDDEDDNDNDEEYEYIKKKEKKSKKKKKESHMNSVNFVDVVSGRQIRGKGNFKYFDRFGSNSNNRNNDKKNYFEHKRIRERERERERERFNKREREEFCHRNDLMMRNEIEIYENAKFFTIDNDANMVSSVISTFTSHELCEQEDLVNSNRHRQYRQLEQYRSRSRSRSRNNNKMY